MENQIASNTTRGWEQWQNSQPVISKKVADDLPAEILEVCDDKAGKCRLKLMQVLFDL